MNCHSYSELGYPSSAQLFQTMPYDWLFLSNRWATCMYLVFKLSACWTICGYNLIVCLFWKIWQTRWSQPIVAWSLVCDSSSLSISWFNLSLLVWTWNRLGALPCVFFSHSCSKDRPHWESSFSIHICCSICSHSGLCLQASGQPIKWCLLFSIHTGSLYLSVTPKFYTKV